MKVIIKWFTHLPRAGPNKLRVCCLFNYCWKWDFTTRTHKTIIFNSYPLKARFFTPQKLRMTRIRAIKEKRFSIFNKLRSFWLSFFFLYQVSDVDRITARGVWFYEPSHLTLFHDIPREPLIIRSIVKFDNERGT